MTHISLLKIEQAKLFIYCSESYWKDCSHNANERRLCQIGADIFYSHELQKSHKIDIQKIQFMWRYTILFSHCQQQPSEACSMKLKCDVSIINQANSARSTLSGGVHYQEEHIQELHCTVLFFLRQGFCPTGFFLARFWRGSCSMSNTSLSLQEDCTLFP